MESIVCPICGSNDYEIFKKMKNRDNYSSNILPEKFISICSKCGLIYQNPCICQKDMNLIYKQYEDKISNSDEHLTVTKIENQKRVEKLIYLLKPPKRILEIGCSDGTFLFEMAKHGFQCVGIDPSKANLEKFMKCCFGKNIIYLNDFFESADIPGKFDVIFHHFVLEHSYNPKIFLWKAKKLIKDDGLIIFEVPNVEIFASLPFAIDLFPYQHIMHFHRKSLQNLLSLTGWEICEEIKLGLSSKSYGMKIAAKPIKDVNKLIVTDNCYHLSRQVLKSYFDTLNINIEIIQKRLRPLIRKSNKSRKGIVIFGAGENGQFIVENTNICQQAAKVYFCDSNKNLRGKEIKGIRVLSPSEITDLDFCAVIVATIDYQEDIVFTLKTLNVDTQKIFTLYDYKKSELGTRIKKI